MENNLVFGAATDGADYSPGTHSVRIRRSNKESYIEANILIVRPATKEEYIAYHKQENIPYEITSNDQYFAFYMD